MVVFVKQTLSDMQALGGFVKEALGLIRTCIFPAVYGVVSQALITFSTAVKLGAGHDDIRYVCEMVLEANGCVNVTDCPSPKSNS
ncbi:hypothetical protein FNO01nite_29620 [Flavobacterium noncentrifugens]|nr:hypothetical protein FNO01nite_29620 [Flavobacterium noncentrifugens]